LRVRCGTHFIRTSLGMNPDLAFTRVWTREPSARHQRDSEGRRNFSAVRKKILTRGVMYACVLHDVDIVLTARFAMRDQFLAYDRHYPSSKSHATKARRCDSRNAAGDSPTFACGSQHARAAAKTVCVDIDRSAVERAVEHQPLQSIGLVTDVEPFLRELADYVSEARLQRIMAFTCASCFSVRPITTASSTKSIPG